MRPPQPPRRQKPETSTPVPSPVALRRRVVPVSAQDRTVVSTGMVQRFAERAAMRRRRLWVRLAVWLGLWVSAIFLVWAAFFSPFLGLDPDEITMSGVGTMVEASDIQAVAAEQSGVPLTRVNIAAMRKSIMALNGVKSVSISRSWPQGLDLLVVSREPVAAVPQEGQFILVDDEMVKVGQSSEPPASLPVINIPWNEGQAPPQTLRAALGVLAAVPPSLAGEVVQVSAATQDDVQMTLQTGQMIVWGGSDQMELKVMVLNTLRNLPENSAVTVFDVSSPTTPVTKS